MRYHFAIPCWGAFYIDYFLDLSLPSMLAPGNLPAFATPENCRLQIYTRPGDRAQFEASPVMAEAARYATIDLRMLPDQFAREVSREQIGLKLDMMSLVHQAGIKAAQGLPDTAISLVNADLIYADGALSHAAKLMADGAGAVLAAIPRMSLETGRPLIEAFRSGNAPALVIPPRGLAGCMRPGMLPEWRTREWGHPTFTKWPNQFFWPAGGKSFVMRALHTHPIFVRPDRKIERLTMTVDRDYVFTVIDDHSRIHLATHSDDICMVDLSPDDYLKQALGSGPQDAHAVAQWIAGFAAPESQLRQILKPLVFLADEAEREACEQAARDSQPVAETVVSLARSLGFMAKKFGAPQLPE
ncbi:MAG: hypothetical protein RJQ21_20390 [Rhodospirillales bacterium]